MATELVALPVTKEDWPGQPGLQALPVAAPPGRCDLVPDPLVQARKGWGRVGLYVALRVVKWLVELQFLTQLGSQQPDRSAYQLLDFALLHWDLPSRP